MSEQMRSYSTARGIFSFLEFIGWSVVVIGIIVGFALSGSVGPYVSDGQKILLFLLGGCGSLVGLFFVGAVQHWRAGVDSAEYSQQMLSIARDQLRISKQGLRLQEMHKSSFGQDKLGSSVEAGSSDADEHLGHRTFHNDNSNITLSEEQDGPGEEVTAIDKKVDALDIEKRSDEPMSMLFGPGPIPSPVQETTKFAPQDDPKRDEEPTAPPPSCADTADIPEQAETTSASNSEEGEPDRVEAEETASDLPEDQDEIAARIIEKDGKFFCGHIQFSSREAAEKYVRQYGVNPNARIRKTPY